VRSTVGALVAAEQGIVKALTQERREPLVALGGYLSAADSAAAQLVRNPSDKAARDDYNFAVARVIGTIQEAKLNPWSQPLHVASRGGEFVLTHKPDPRPQWNPALYDFTPADQFDVGGSYVTEKVRKEGVGAPLVAVGKEMNTTAERDFTMQRIFYGVTALIRFEGHRAVIDFEDPLATESVTLDGHSFPLAADFTVPLAVALAKTNPKKLELARLLRPEKYAETARIARLQPYDPNKTVVLVLHGLMDSPATWAPMINHLRADEQIRRNYQFWFYSYPSGYPYPYSASILRHELDEVEKRFPMRKKIVLIGHSMGGCISRLMITDTGDKLWLAIFKKPPGEVHLSAESRKLVSDALIFQHRPEVGRVIFISAPLRGSEMASNWTGRIGSMLVKAPSKLLSVGSDVFKVTTFQTDDLKLKRIPNSVDTLAPNNRFVKAIQTIPITPGIPYHVICGDRGKDGNKDKTKPVMSDGIVPYWSSHMEGAQSELIVHSSHSAHQNPQAIDEVQRILKATASR
jgi:pimeloyl-ACP methyl ester carboxylesterase